MSREVQHDGAGTLRIRFPFDRELVELIKSLPNRRWIAAERYWSVPERDAISLVEMLVTRAFRFDEATVALYRELGGRLPLDDEPQPVSRMGSLFDLAEELGEEDSAEDEFVEGVLVGGGGGEYSVSALNRQVQEALAAAFPRSIWLVGEISGFDRNAHKRVVTFQFDERDPSGRTLSSVAASLFPDERAAIELDLARAGDPFRLGDELTVRARVHVELYVPWGSYRVVVEEIDVAYTLGEAARRREEIVRRLTARGLVGLNPALSLPALPLRVGLITSLGSDAYRDVLRTFEESGFAFQVTAHGARVQGHATELTVLNALDWFRERAADFDVILICRGGGSRTDLAWFDSEPLGEAVARFPLPIVVGIGHEQDHSVLDAVARRAKTPTAAAALIVATVALGCESVERRAAAVLDLAARCMANEHRRGVDRARRLVTAARGCVAHEKTRLDHRGTRTAKAVRACLAAASETVRRSTVDVPRQALVLLGRQTLFLEVSRRAVAQGARRDVGSETKRLDELARGLRSLATRGVQAESERFEGRARRLDLVDPRRVLERGYAILRTESGHVLTDAAAAPAGVAVRAELRRGTLRLTSEGQGHG